jgi:hypothetical protein
MAVFYLEKSRRENCRAPETARGSAIYEGSIAGKPELKGARASWLLALFVFTAYCGPLLSVSIALS